MAQLRPSSVETETVWGKSEAKFGPTPLRRKSKNREKYREIYEFGLRIIKILPRFRRVPGKGQGNSSDSWDSCRQALGSQWFTLAFCSGVVTGPGNHQGSRFLFWNSTPPQVQIRKPSAVLAASGKTNCRCCPFPDIFIQPRTQVYKGRYEEYCLALFFDEVTVFNALAGQAH